MLLCITACTRLPAEKFYTYIGELGPDRVLIAWGTTKGVNTIGRTSKAYGKAEVRVGDRQMTVTDRNWVLFSGLESDKEYEYDVRLDGARIGGAKIRTWPTESQKLRFFVIGDYGTGDRNQFSVAATMVKEFERHQGDNPVRFVITTGDNIYGSLGFTLRFRDSGDEDDDWESKFFRPYESVLAHIPFYPSLGNHDGNETEARGDLAQYLDNFFFPGIPDKGARFYRFNYGGFVDFFALDTTTGSESSSPRPVYLRNSEQFKWLLDNLASSRVTWKIPYMHHPPYNAGPRHPAVRNELAHFIDAFKRNGVKVVFTGHEHNFQFSPADNETGGVRYVITGSGGELRAGDVKREMARAHIEGWAPANHFLSVEIEGNEMRITPIFPSATDVVDRTGKKIEMPLRIPAR